MHPLKQYPHNIVSSSKRQFILLSACLTIASLQIGAVDSASEIRADLYYSVAEANYQMGDSEAANRVIDQILRIQSDHVAARQLRKQIKESPRPEKQAVNHTDTRKQNQTALIAPESQSTLATLGQAIDSDHAGFGQLPAGPCRTSERSGRYGTTTLRKSPRATPFTGRPPPSPHPLSSRPLF